MLALTGAGMMSSVGWSVAPACAAILAGITRPQPVPGLRFPDRDLLDPLPVLGHPVPACTEGFGPLGRWLRLAQACVSDLRQTSALPPPSESAFWLRTAWICVLPYLDMERYLEVRDVGPDIIRSSYQDRLFRLLGLPYRKEAVHFVHEGHVGTASALQLAQRFLAERFAERVCIIATDSYLDEMSLEWLLSSQRLKVSDHPAGLMPGEAGVCLLVEPLRAAHQPHAPIHAIVEAVPPPPDAVPPAARQRMSGQALAQAVEQTLLAALPEGSFTGSIFCDLNGEEWRAQAWGHVRVRLGERLSQETRLHLPCTSLGDVGAASGAVATCLAAHAFARRHAPPDCALVLSISEHGEVGAVRVHAPGTLG